MLVLEQNAKAKNYNSGVKNGLPYVQYTSTLCSADKNKLETVLKFSSFLFLPFSPFTESNFFQDLVQLQNFVKNQLGDLLFQSGLPGSISSLQYSRPNKKGKKVIEKESYCTIEDLKKQIRC